MSRAQYWIIVPLAVIVLTLIPAVAWPSSDVRRVLFAVALLAAVVVLLAFSLILWSALDSATTRADLLEIRIGQLERNLAKHIVVCDVHSADSGINDALRELVEHDRRSRSFEEG